MHRSSVITSYSIHYTKLYEIQKQLEPKLGIAYQKYGDDAVIDSLMYYCSRNFRINALYEQFMDGQQAVQET